MGKNVEKFFILFPYKELTKIKQDLFKISFLCFSFFFLEKLFFYIYYRKNIQLKY